MLEASNSPEIERVSDWYNKAFWDGMIVEIERLFPSLESRRFWERVFRDVDTPDGARSAVDALLVARRPRPTDVVAERL